MINGLSRLVSFLIANAEQPIAIADNIEIQCPMLTSIMPGRMIMSAPIKPMMIAAHRRARRPRDGGRNSVTGGLEAAGQDRLGVAPENS